MNELKRVAKSKRAELLSSVGAGVLGAGIALLLAKALAPYAVAILLIGLGAHAYGMFEKHQLERQAEFRHQEPIMDITDLPRTVSPATAGGAALIPNVFDQAWRYQVDLWQRSILFLDVLRERANNMLAHEAAGLPPLIHFEYETILDARRFERPARAASGIEHFDELLDEAARRAPQRRLVDADEVGRAALLLASDHAWGVTGEVLHVDAGFHVEGMVFH